eukprot:PhF_6_TR26306/c0_g1_i3/m.37766
MGKKKTSTAKPHPRMPVDVLVIVGSFLDLESATRCQRVNKVWGEHIVPPVYITNGTVNEINTAKAIATDVMTRNPPRCHVDIAGFRFRLERPTKCKPRPIPKDEIDAQWSKARITSDVLTTLSQLPIHSLRVQHHCDKENDRIFLTESEWFNFFKSIPVERIFANHRSLFLHDTAWLSLPYLQDVEIGNEVADGVAELCVALCPRIVNLTVQPHWTSDYSSINISTDTPIILDNKKDDDEDSDDFESLFKPEYPNVRYAVVNRAACNSFVGKFSNLITFEGEPSHTRQSGPKNIFHANAKNTLTSVSLHQTCHCEQFHFLLQCSSIECIEFDNSDVGTSFHTITE